MSDPIIQSALQKLFDDGFAAGVASVSKPDGVRVFQGKGKGGVIPETQFAIYGRSDNAEFFHEDGSGPWTHTIETMASSSVWRELHGAEKQAALAKCQPPQPITRMKDLGLELQARDAEIERLNQELSDVRRRCENWQAHAKKIQAQFNEMAKIIGGAA